MCREAALNKAGGGYCEAPSDQKGCTGRAGEVNGLLAKVLIEGWAGDRPGFGGTIIVEGGVQGV